MSDGDWLVGYPTDGETGETAMSMTKNAFRGQYLHLAYKDESPQILVDQVVALAEEAGMVWDPEPTPEPFGDLSMVRVIDAEENTWGPRPAPFVGWVRLIDGVAKPWSEIPQPVTVLRPEGSER